LIVATSNEGDASAAMGATRAGGAGMAQAVSAFARVRLSGSGRSPGVKLPVIVRPSALILPS
jgi:hypothetical protein